MDRQDRPDRPSRISVGMMDVAVAALLALFGALVIFDSRRVGAGWGADGPQAGYFPFYIGSLLAVAGVVILLHTVRGWVRYRAWFATVQQFRNVFAVLWPTCLYVAAIYGIGIYTASALFIAWFMVRHGGFGWLLTLSVSVGVPLALFFLFDRWFLVPLPKGPLERMLGY